MKHVLIVALCSFLAGCAGRFYSNMDHGELSRYGADVYREGNTLVVDITNIAGLNIYELDHRVESDAFILSAHRISSGRASKRTFRMEIPENVREVYWLNTDGSRTPVSFKQRSPNKITGRAELNSGRENRGDTS